MSISRCVASLTFRYRWSFEFNTTPLNIVTVNCRVRVRVGIYMFTQDSTYQSQVKPGTIRSSLPYHATSPLPPARV